MNENKCLMLVWRGRLKNHLRQLQTIFPYPLTGADVVAQLPRTHVVFPRFEKIPFEIFAHICESVYAAKCYQELKARNIYGNGSKYKFQFSQEL